MPNPPPIAQLPNPIAFVLAPPAWFETRLPYVLPCATTPGTSVSRLLMFRPFSGMRSIASRGTTFPSDEVSVCSSGRSPVTVTASETLPISNVTSTRVVTSTCTCTPSRMNCLKPGSCTATRYVPGGMLGTEYVPALPETVERTSLVLNEVTSIVAPGTGAPL